MRIAGDSNFTPLAKSRFGTKVFVSPPGKAIVDWLFVLEPNTSWAPAIELSGGFGCRPLSFSGTLPPTAIAGRVAYRSSIAAPPEGTSDIGVRCT